jgi:hypothetical protein
MLIDARTNTLITHRRLLLPGNIGILFNSSHTYDNIPAIQAKETLITTNSVWSNWVRYCYFKILRLRGRKLWWPHSVLGWSYSHIHFKYHHF